MNESLTRGDFVKVFWKDADGKLVKDCKYGNAVGTVSSVGPDFVMLVIRRKLRRIHKDRIKLVSRGMFA